MVLINVVLRERDVGALESTVEAHAKTAARTPEKIDVGLARHGGTPR